MFISKNRAAPTYKISLIKSQVYRAMNTYLTRVLEPYDLSPPDWALLGILYERGSMNPTEIAHYLGVKPPVVTAALRRIEAGKLIKKGRHLKDGRFTSMTLTKAGQELVKEVEEKIQNDLKKFTKGIRRSDIDAYFRVLNQMSEKLRNRIGS